MPTPPPTVTGTPSRCISGKGPCHAFIHQHAHVTSSNLLRPHLVGAYSERGSCPASHICSAHVRFGRLLPVHSVDISSRTNPCLASFNPYFPHRLRPSSAHIVGASPRRILCHASFQKHAHAASGGLLPAYLVYAYSGWGSCPASPISTSTPPQVVSYRFTKLVHLPEGGPIKHPYTGSAHVPSSRHLLAYLVRPRHLSWSPTGARSWIVFREGFLPRLPQWQRPHRFRPSPTDAPS